MAIPPREQRTVWALAWSMPILAALVEAACGGSTDSSSTPDGSTTTEDASAWGDAGLLDASDDSPWSPVCPESMPTLGADCGQPPFRCEYGSAWWSAQCDTFTFCNNGTWQKLQISSDTTCLPSPGPNPPECGDAPAALTCADAGQECIYDSGVTCVCYSAIDGGVGVYCLPDTPNNGCPGFRPRVGSTCDAGIIPCDYSPRDPTQETCLGGIWGITVSLRP